MDNYTNSQIALALFKALYYANDDNKDPVIYDWNCMDVGFSSEGGDKAFPKEYIPNELTCLRIDDTFELMKVVKKFKEELKKYDQSVSLKDC